jgi:hypothetical protein
MFARSLAVETLTGQGALRLIGVRQVASVQQKQQKIAKKLAAPWQQKNKPPPSQPALDLARRVLTSSEFLDQPGLLRLKKTEVGSSCAVSSAALKTNVRSKGDQNIPTASSGHGLQRSTE